MSLKLNSFNSNVLDFEPAYFKVHKPIRFFLQNSKFLLIFLFINYVFSPFLFQNSIFSNVSKIPRGTPGTS